jgi:hypothetical protein
VCSFVKPPHSLLKTVRREGEVVGCAVDLYGHGERLDVGEEWVVTEDKEDGGQRAALFDATEDEIAHRLGSDHSNEFGSGSESGSGSGSREGSGRRRGRGSRSGSGSGSGSAGIAQLVRF